MLIICSQARVENLVQSGNHAFYNLEYIPYFGATPIFKSPYVMLPSIRKDTRCGGVSTFSTAGNVHGTSSKTYRNLGQHAISLYLLPFGRCAKLNALPWPKASWTQAVRLTCEWQYVMLRVLSRATMNCVENAFTILPLCFSHASQHQMLLFAFEMPAHIFWPGVGR